MTLHVAVCIVGYRNAKDIAQCLGDLALSSYADFEVVICENGGGKAFSELCATVPANLPDGQLVRCFPAKENLGYAGGVNVCMDASPNADAWWVLNPDTRPESGALGALVHCLEQEGCDMAGGILHKGNGTIQSCGGRWSPWLARAESIGFGWSLSSPIDQMAVEASINYISGACILVSRTFLVRVGKMREDYFLYAEEIEWCLRGQAKGMRLGFTPEALILHAGGTTTGSAMAYRSRPKLPVYLDERNKMLLTRDHFRARLPVAAVMAFVLILLRFLRRGALRQFGYAVSGWFDGILGQRGKPLWIQE